jgi:predicted O-methyltransferase YrrM
MLNTVTTRLRSLLHVDPYSNLFVESPRERLAKGLSPRYLVNKALLTIYESRHPDRPWITQTAVLVFDALLRSHHRGLEWGSGNGTRWIAQRCASLVSVEHHPAWHAKVREKLDDGGLKNVDYRLLEEEKYLDVVDEFPDGFFDFVVVDGLFRDSAFLRSVPKLAPGGFVLFDNVNWYLPSDSKTPHSRSLADGPQTPLFAEALEAVKTWKRIWTTNGVNDTAIFIDPLRV